MKILTNEEVSKLTKQELFSDSYYLVDGRGIGFFKPIQIIINDEIYYSLASLSLNSKIKATTNFDTFLSYFKVSARMIFAFEKINLKDADFYLGTQSTLIKFDNKEEYFLTIAKQSGIKLFKQI